VYVAEDELGFIELRETADVEAVEFIEGVEGHFSVGGVETFTFHVRQVGEHHLGERWTV